MTCTEMSSPTRRAAAAPASVAAFDRADVAAGEHRHVSGADVLLPDEHDVRRFDHGVGGLDGADETTGFNHAERVAGKGCRHVMTV